MAGTLIFYISEANKKRGTSIKGEEGHTDMNIMRKFLGGSQDSGRPPGPRGQEYHPEQVG